MAYREFFDQHGVLWKAWDTYPDLAQRVSVSAGMEKGWVSFDNGTERKRLSPIPASWSGASERELRGWLDSAAGVVLTRPTAERPDSSPPGR